VVSLQELWHLRSTHQLGQVYTGGIAWPSRTVWVRGGLPRPSNRAKTLACRRFEVAEVDLSVSTGGVGGSMHPSAFASSRQIVPRYSSGSRFCKRSLSRLTQKLSFASGRRVVRMWALASPSAEGCSRPNSFWSLSAAASAIPTVRRQNWTCQRLATPQRLRFRHALCSLSADPIGDARE